MSLEAILAQLHARQNDQVLPITVHVMHHPLRIALLDANGDRHEYVVDGDDLLPQRAAPKLEVVEAADGKPPAQRIVASGFNADLYGRF